MASNPVGAKKNYYEVLVTCNTMLCHASAGSELMGRAYECRSNIYLKIGQYDMCIENIDRARLNRYPRIQELNNREQECRDLMARCQPHADPWDTLKLSYPPHQLVPFMANCLEFDNETRRVTTNVDLKPGDIVAIEETTARHVDEAATYRRCFHCLASNKLNLEPCAGPCTTGNDAAPTTRV